MYKQYDSSEGSLVPNFDYTIPEDHDALFISQFVDSIPDTEFSDSLIFTGRPNHHPRMLLKMILFAYSRSVFSGRKIVQMNEEELPMRWLTRDQYVSYHSINNFRENPTICILIPKAYIYFLMLLKERDHVKNKAVSTDETKIDSDANKNFFVWKRISNRYNDRFNEKIKDIYDELIGHKVKKAIADDERDTGADLEQMIERIGVDLKNLNMEDY